MLFIQRTLDQLSSAQRIQSTPHFTPFGCLRITVAWLVKLSQKRRRVTKHRRRWGIVAFAGVDSTKTMLEPWTVVFCSMTVYYWFVYNCNTTSYCYYYTCFAATTYIIYTIYNIIHTKRKISKNNNKSRGPYWPIWCRFTTIAELRPGLVNPGVNRVAKMQKVTPRFTPLISD